VDIVFVHGIRGGPFASWCSRACPDGHGRESCGREHCWPSQWLAPVVPHARLLSLEYAAPASGWEVRPWFFRATQRWVGRMDRCSHYRLDLVVGGQSCGKVLAIRVACAFGALSLNRTSGSRSPTSGWEIGHPLTTFLAISLPRPASPQLRGHTRPGNHPPRCTTCALQGTHQRNPKTPPPYKEISHPRCCGWEKAWSI